jgi:hypothetical protein
MVCIAEALVIVDLSQGDPEIQRLYSERICRQIFADAMARFIGNKSNNFMQFYFEEAHNLFPRKEDKDLSQVYNRIAKEGAKLNLGLIYATQEVSSITGNILKNTQNWFIAPGRPGQQTGFTGEPSEYTNSPEICRGHDEPLNAATVTETFFVDPCALVAGRLFNSSNRVKLVGDHGQICPSHHTEANSNASMLDLNL